MVANLDWVNTAPDSENNYTMACPFPLEGEPSGTGPAPPPNIAMAVLLCRKNSHPFEKRTLLLHNPVKVGRSVAKTKADPNNAIFDCKVLSRHHASLWYENGHFYLADTNSSNGTFVNSYRLSEGNKESAPHEVSSGDIVQFGVDVMENSGSVTHGCIVATLKLYLPDGKEAKSSSSLTIDKLDEIHILHKIIQEATEREYMLEEKLNSLRQAVENCRSSAEMSWRAQVYEDHLLCRVHFLEKRVAAAGGTAAPNEFQQLLEDKHNYEVSAKESLRQAQEERLKLMNQVCSLQWSLCSSEDECAALRNSTERAHEEYQKLSSKHSSLEQQLKTAQKALTNAENRLAEEKRRVKELIADNEKQIAQIKSDYEKHAVMDTGLGDLLDSEKNNIIMDNKTWEKGDYKESSLPEAIRGLPNYIKAILPDQILQKVGCKSLRGSSQVNELQLKLYSLKNELERCQLESERDADEVNDNAAHAAPDGEVEDDSSENTIKQEPVLNSINNVNIDETKQSVTIIDGDNENIDNLSEEKNFVNRNKMALENSNFKENSDKDSISDTKLSLLDEIKKITEQIDQVKEDDGPIEKMMFLQEELSNAQSKIVSLRNEQKSLNASLADSHSKILELKQDKDLLLSEKKELENEIAEKSELCRTLELHLSHWKEKEKTDEASSAKYKEVALELQNKLSKAFESEANSCKELKDLNAKIFDLQKQLDNRPHISDIETLKTLVESLQNKLDLKEKETEALKLQLVFLTDIQLSLEEKLSKQMIESTIVKQEEPTIKVEEANKTENNIKTTLSPEKDTSEQIIISSSLSAASLMWDQNRDKFLLSDGTVLPPVMVDIKRMSELEEELVVTKEKWAHANEDRSQLASELQNVTEKYNRLASRSTINSLAYIVPVVAVLLYVLIMYQSIS